MARNDEHTLNTALAERLRRRSPAWREANLLTSEDLGALEGLARPDILIRTPGGAPVAVETEFEPARTVEKDAGSRLNLRAAVSGERIEQAVAVRMPAGLRDVPETALADRVEETRLSFAVVSAPPPHADTTEHGVGWARFPETDWLEGGVDDLAGLIETLGVSERAIAASTDILETAVRRAAGRLSQSLADKPGVLRKIAEYLVQDPGDQTERMAMAIVANACAFHAAIAGAHDIRQLAELRLPSGALPRDAVLAEWTAILRINYWPIFRIARDILVKIPSAVAAGVLDIVAKAADDLAAEGATTSHDLTGRMFQRLIQDRKFLATFYTRPEAAALLADLAVGRMELDWSRPEGMTAARVADLACGTGTLLSAAYHALIGRHRRAGGDDRPAHHSMMEECLIGADIMPAATHLTASMLSSVHPTVPYRRTQVYTLPYGSHPEVVRPSLGSLSLLDGAEMPSLFGTGLAAGIEGLGGKGSETVSEWEMQSRSFAIADESLDLVIMNPPFTRPTNHEITKEQVPSFAGFGNTEAEQEAMSGELKRLRTLLARRKGPGDAPPASNGNAGLASNFLDLAHLKLRPGGTLALVMPASLALGDAWSASRALLAQHYSDLLIVSLATARSEERSFSADTGMAEVLVLARKRTDPGPEDPVEADATWVSLTARPKSVAEAYETSRTIRLQMERSGKEHGSVFTVWLGGQSAGSGIRACLGDGGCAGISDLSLAQAAMELSRGRFLLQRSSETIPIPITRLEKVGTRGPLDRDVGGRRGAAVRARGPFEIVPVHGVPTFPVLWSHDASRERKLGVEPDSMGSVLPGRDRDAASVWGSASRLHFNRDFRVNSQSLAACLTPAPAIGGRAWPSFAADDPAWEEALAVWANTTLGLLLFWWIGSAQQSGRTVLTLGRLPHLPTLDPRALSDDQIRRLQAAATALAGEDFLPAHRAHEDPVRKELDRLVFGDALGWDAEALAEIALLRDKWCAEPTVHGGKRR